MVFFSLCESSKGGWDGDSEGLGSVSHLETRWHDGTKRAESASMTR